MILNKGIPAAFIDSNSYLSPKLPNVIKAANKIAKGRDKGKKYAEAVVAKYALLFEELVHKELY